jgi:hypothetical protein
MTLTALQSRLHDLVVTAPLLSGRPVLTEDKGNLVADLEAALQTQSLAVVVALSSGEIKEGSLPRRGAWDETFEIVVHRGLLDAESVPSTPAVLDELIPLLHGAAVDAQSEAAGKFACRRHELRESGDGAYCRVLTVRVTHTRLSSPPSSS